MKKLLTLLLTLFMVFTLVGCNSKQEEAPTIDEPQVEESTIVGGYIEAEDKNLTPELIEMFEKAFEGFVGASYTPVNLEATQVVASTNYKFKADGTKTTNPIITGSYYVYINKDLQDNISLLDIEVIEEHEVKKLESEVKLDSELKKDVTNMSFWVVFYDQYGNELQRETLKYGSTPSYTKDLPEGFDKWVYKNTQKDVGTFKAITGNTYYQAVCHEVKHKNNSDPVPDPEYVQVEYLTSQPGAYINSKVTASNDMEFIFDAKMGLVEWCRCFGYLNSTNSGLAFQSATGEYGGDLMFYASDGTNTNQYAQSGVSLTQKNTYDVKYGGTTTDASFIKVNGITVKTFTTGSISIDKEIAIFSLIDGQETEENKKALSIYYMKIYKNGELVRDYIPVKTNKEIDKSKNAKDSDTNIPIDTLCMYDKVENKYYPSFGDKPFTEDDPACLAKGTMISMADGSQKPIEDLKHGDDIKVFNHKTGTISHSKILDYWHYEDQQLGLITLHFTNDINVNIVKEHGFYCKEENTYVVLNRGNINEYINKQFYNADSNRWETLLSVTYSDEKVDTYYLATEKHYNCIAEGMLNVEDGVYYVVCSTFNYDDNMIIDNQEKYADIMKYGLFTYEDFKYLTKDEFDSHNLAYLKVALGKGIITKADLKLLEDIWTNEKEILAGTN